MKINLLIPLTSTLAIGSLAGPVNAQPQSDLNGVATEMTNRLQACSRILNSKDKTQCLFEALDWMIKNPDTPKIFSKYPGMVVSVRHGLFGAQDYCKVGVELGNGSETGEAECQAELREALVTYVIAILERPDAGPLPFVPSKYLKKSAQ